jgi:hypothetical protein
LWASQGTAVSVSNDIWNLLSVLTEENVADILPRVLSSETLSCHNEVVQCLGNTLGSGPTKSGPESWEINYSPGLPESVEERKAVPLASDLTCITTSTVASSSTLAVTAHPSSQNLPLASSRVIPHLFPPKSFYGPSITIEQGF